jgi:hypothetical protein
VVGVKLGTIVCVRALLRLKPPRGIVPRGCCQRGAPELFRIANLDKLRAGEDLYYRDGDEYDTDRGALWQLWRRYRRWTVAS